jgi:Xaa-Pro aminopeptidase
VPFDREAIDVSLLTDRELELLNDYHARVYRTISPYLAKEEAEWLREATAPLGK